MLVFSAAAVALFGPKLNSLFTSINITGKP